MVRGSLNFATRPPRNASSSPVSSGPGPAPGDRFDHRLDFFAPVVVRDAEHGDVGHRRVAGKLGLDLGRVDVHPARDDHVAAPVAQEQVAVGVQVADVADGEQLARPRRPRLLLVLVIGERRRAHLHVDQALLAGRYLVVRPVEHVHLRALPRQADRPRLAQPLFRRDEGPAALGRRVVLDDDRSQPVDHLPFDLRRARCRAVDDRPQRAGVVPPAHLAGQGQQPPELGRHGVRMRHPVPFDEPQRFLGVPAVHQHHGVAELDRDRGEVEHGGVVERRAAQMHVAVERRQPEQAEEPGRHHPAHFVRVGPGERAAHALGPAGGARCVHHGRAVRPWVRALVRAVPAQPAQRLEAGHRPGREPVLDPGQVGRYHRDVGKAIVRYEDASAAVPEDVGDLARDLVPVDRHDVKAGLDRREVHGERGDAVGQQRRDRVPRAQAKCLQAAAAAVRLAGQFRVGHGPAAGLDHGGPAG